MATPQILVVEDDQVIALDIRQSVKSMGYEVSVAHTAESAMEMAARQKPDLALMDIKLGGRVDGITVAQELRTRWSIPIIYLTAYADTETLRRSVQSGVFAHLTKPIRMEELRVAIRIALRQHNELSQVLQSHEWLSALLGNITEGVVAVDPQGAVMYLNAQAESMTGWSLAQASGNPVEKVLRLSSPEQQSPAPLRIKTVSDSRSGMPKQQFFLHGRSKQPILVEEIVTPLWAGGRFLGALSLLRDVTEALKLEQSRKWESVGVLAAGTAHDFNNLLTVVIGNIGLAKQGLPDDDEAQLLLRESYEAARRMAKLTSQLQAYAGNSGSRRQTVNFVAIIQGLTGLLRAAVAEHVSFSIRVPASLPSVEADPSQVKEVILNLVLNAAEAIDSNPGAICLSAEPAGDAPGVVLRVEDTGHGIPSEILPKIFDPFFSTKLLGRGLGLAAVQGIMRAHGGTVTVETKPGKGSVFTLFFPS